MIRVRGPAGVNGLGWLTWRPIDGSAPERTWMFAPALRRVRALSAAQRADGVAALAISIDDGSCFDGRLESFTWSVIGRQDILAPIVAATPLVLLRQRSAALDQDLRGDWFTVVTLTSH
jgi:hypothetical protein